MSTKPTVVLSLSCLNSLVISEMQSKVGGNGCVGKSNDEVSCTNVIVSCVVQDTQGQPPRLSCEVWVLRLVSGAG